LRAGADFLKSRFLRLRELVKVGGRRRGGRSRCRGIAYRAIASATMVAKHNFDSAFHAGDTSSHGSGRPLLFAKTLSSLDFTTGATALRDFQPLDGWRH